MCAWLRSAQVIDLLVSQASDPAAPHNSPFDATISLMWRASWWLCANVQAKNLPKDYSCYVCHPDVPPLWLFLLNTMLWLSCVLPVWLGPQPSANKQRSHYFEGCWVMIEGPEGLWEVMEEWISHLSDFCLSIFSACTQDQAAVRRCGRPLQAVQLPQRGAGQAHPQVRLYGGFCGRPERRQSDPAAGAEASPLRRPEVTAAGTDACAH